MRIGKLDRRVAIQRKSLSYSDSGVPIEGWATLAVRWATKSPLLGEEERYAIETTSAREKVRFTIRWESLLADLSPLDRIICPQEDAGDSPIPTRSIYDVSGVGEVGRQDQLEVFAFRRSDVSP